MQGLPHRAHSGGRGRQRAAGQEPSRSKPPHWRAAAGGGQPLGRLRPAGRAGPVPGRSSGRAGAPAVPGRPRRQGTQRSADAAWGNALGRRRGPWRGRLLVTRRSGSASLRHSAAAARRAEADPARDRSARGRRRMARYARNARGECYLRPVGVRPGMARAGFSSDLRSGGCPTAGRADHTIEVWSLESELGDIRMWSTSPAPIRCINDVAARAAGEHLCDGGTLAARLASRSAGAAGRAEHGHRRCRRFRTQLCAVQVKARLDKGSDGGWRMRPKREEPLVGDRLFYAFAGLRRIGREHSRTYIMPSLKVAEFLSRSHASWLSIRSQMVASVRTPRRRLFSVLRLLPSARTRTHIPRLDGPVSGAWYLLRG